MLLDIVMVLAVTVIAFTAFRVKGKPEIEDDAPPMSGPLPPEEKV